MAKAQVIKVVPGLSIVSIMALMQGKQVTLVNGLHKAKVIQTATGLVTVLITRANGKQYKHSSYSLLNALCVAVGFVK